VGFQGPDPTTDLRGGGELALRNLVWFVEAQPEFALPMMRKRRRPDNAAASAVSQTRFIIKPISIRVHKLSVCN